MVLPELGDILMGKHRLDEVLGEGGFGVVFGATTLSSNRSVAIKVLKPGNKGYDTVRAERFMRELRAIAKLTNPHTVTLFDFGRTPEGLMFMVCEMVHGEDLLELMNRRGRVTESETVHILKQVLRSLKEAHELGVLHRDIKPGNIRLFRYRDDPLRVKVLDFGLAKSLQYDENPLTAAGKVVGTPRYMSPEQLYGHELTPASDLYSLGLVAYEMLLGRSSRDMFKIGDKPFLSVADPVSDDVRLAINRMLEAEVDDRAKSTDEMLAILNALRLTKPPKPRSESPAPSSVPTTSPDVATTAEDAEAPPTAPLHAETAPTPLYSPVQHEEVKTASTLQQARVQGPAGPDGPTRPRIEAARVSAGAGLEQHGREEPPVASPAQSRGRNLVAAVAAIVALGVGLTWAIARIVETTPTSTPDARRPARLAENPLGAPATGAAETSAADAGTPNSAEPPPAYLTGGSSGCGQEAPFLGTDRLFERWSTYVPSGYQTNHKHPLVILLHQDYERPEDLLRHSGFAELSESDEFIIIAPSDGAFKTWRDRVDELPEIRRAYDAAAEAFCLDPGRVFVVSNGNAGRVARYLSCESWVTATASNSYSTQTNDNAFDCEPAAAKPFFQLLPMNSPHLPSGGGNNCSDDGFGRAGPGKKDSFESNQRQRVDHHRCTGDRQILSRHEHGTCYTWTCERRFVDCRLDGGHGWPGAPLRLTDIGPCFGPSPAPFPAGKLIWEFFESVESLPKR